MGNKDKYAQDIQTAYDAVKGLEADEAFKLEGYKIVLQSILGEVPHAPINHAPGKKDTFTISEEVDQDSWQAKVSSKLDLTTEQVSSIYYYDGDSLKIIIDHKKMPKSLSQSTQHLAALLAAGRQALKLDDSSTDYEFIRAVCKEYGVFNSKNFTSYIKQLGSRFIYGGSGQSQTILLTHPAYTITSEIAKRYIESEA